MFSNQASSRYSLCFPGCNGSASVQYRMPASFFEISPLSPSLVLREKYIDWERGRSGPAALANLYGRVLQIPIRELDRFWDKCEDSTASLSLFHRSSGN